MVLVLFVGQYGDRPEIQCRLFSVPRRLQILCQFVQKFCFGNPEIRDTRRKKHRRNFTILFLFEVVNGYLTCQPISSIIHCFSFSFLFCFFNWQMNAGARTEVDNIEKYHGLAAWLSELYAYTIRLSCRRYQFYIPCIFHVMCHGHSSIYTLWIKTQAHYTVTHNFSKGKPKCPYLVLF